MEVTIQEVVPEINKRTAAGRVVINPPKATGCLKLRTTGSLTMCCNRAFLTEESYSKHLAEKTEHNKLIDPSKFPKINPYSIEYQPKALYDRSRREFWRSRKTGTTLNLIGIREEDEDFDEADDVVQKFTVTDRTVTANGKWKKCGICNLTIMKGNMHRHNKKCHSDGKYKCKYCPCTFEVDSSRKAHQKRMHRVKRPPAVNLQKNLLARAKKQLVSLKAKGKEKKSHECPHCGKIMNNIVNFRGHLNTHSGERPYKCDVCEFRFRHLQNLKRHMRVAHPEDGKYYCSICKCRFSSYIVLGAHNRSVHPDKREAKSPKITKITPMKTQSLLPNPNTVLPQLRLQYPAPNSSGLYECHICHKELSTSQTWRGHMLIHQNLKPYKCKLCGIHFRLHSTLSNHVKVAHSGGSFRCKICSCRYTNAKGLYRHNKEHHSKTKCNILKSTMIGSEKKASAANDENTVEVSTNFKCDLCGMMTNDQHLYKDHLLLHSQNSKTRCDLCLKVFNGSASVQLHKQRAHGKGFHKCSFCCCRYGGSQALFKHLKSEHGMERSDWSLLTKKLTPDGRRRIQSNLVLISASKWGDGSYVNEEVKEESKERSQPIILGVERKYACDICDKRFIWKGSVFNHKKAVHGIAGKYQCLKCRHKFRNKSELARHEKLVHRVSVSSKQSKQTSLVESNENQIKEVQPLQSQNSTTTDNPRKKYRCDLCSMKFLNRSGVAVHQKKCHFHKGVIECSQCSCKFLTMHGLIVHRVQAHGYMGKKRTKITQELTERIKSSTPMISANAVATTNRHSKKFYCNECGKFIIGTFAYRAHVKSHGSKKMFECDICHMKFRNRSNIAQHKKRSHNHTGEVQCPMCPCRFITIGGLANHQKHFHGLVGRKTITELTNGSAFNASLNSNPSPSQRDESINKFRSQDTINEVTGKSRSDKKEFVLHSETYDRNQDKQYECNICHARFQHKGSIVKHKKTAHYHKGTFKCPDCVCKFLTPNSLVLHRKNQHELNMGEIKMLIVSKPSVQKLSTFKKAKKVLKNTLSRRRDTPGTCDICGITIGRKTYMKKHKEVAHSNGKYPCSECCCSFHSMVGLGKHRRLHKPGSRVRKTKEDNKRVLEIAEPKEDQLENHAPIEVNCSDSPSSKVNLNFLKIRGSALPSKRTASFNPPNSPEKTPTLKSSEPENVTEGPEHVYPSKPPRGALAASAYRFKCELCGIRFSETVSLRRHKTKAHTNGTVQCDLCSCKFVSNIGLAAHKRVYHNPTLTGATDSFKPNKTERRKRIHYDEHLDTMEVSKSIDNINSLPKMLFGKLRKNSGKRVKCKICSIAFSVRSLPQHMKKAHTNGSFRCLKCSCTFSTIYSLTAHKRVYHNASMQGKGIFNNFTRNKKLSEATPKLNNTKLSKTKQSTDVSQPGIAANVRTSTRRHDRVENTTASDNETLQDTPNAENVISTYVRTPSNASPSEVKPTKASFKKPGKVPSKSKTLGFGKYPCDFCIKSFANLTLLKRHLKSHTRPEQCTQCSMRFRTRDEVAKHISISHGDGIHQCYACPCRFTSTNGLKMHLKLIHERQSQSYDDNNIVIEQHEDLADGEPIFNGFLKPPCPKSLQTDDDDFVEDSVPIIEGMIETTYSVANSQVFFREIRTISSDLYYSEHDENFVDESEPIIQGILTLDSNPSVHQSYVEPPPPPQQKRKAFSPKSRPMKCSTCGMLCYGPEKLRQHMESHVESDPLAICNDETIDPLAICNGETIEPTMCSKCNLEFTTMPDLMEHLQVDHDVSGLYKCVYCPCSMKTEAALQSHFMKYHSING
ncbi:unnamed protein product [Orchesella dallaii]|uniref:C2H2-type domain-containing protein n=1 Tax=Orchesella dallaii TaxID=48710 RepID=A0ABP1QL14_9HEXA